MEQNFKMHDGVWLITGYRDGLPVVKLKTEIAGDRLHHAIVAGPRVGYGFGGRSCVVFLNGEPVPYDYIMPPQMSEQILFEVKDFLDDLAGIPVDEVEIGSIKGLLSSEILNEDGTIKLVQAVIEDIPDVMGVERGQGNERFICQWTYEQHRQAFASEDVLYVVVKNHYEEKVGFIIIRGLQNPHGILELEQMVMIGKGKGDGQKAIVLLKKWCFEIYQARRLWLGLVTYHQVALHVFEKQGFVREGILRQCARIDNEYQSLVILSMLKEEYEEMEGIEPC